jgi:membrane-bound lytic murein transglycosylase B
LLFADRSEDKFYSFTDNHYQFFSSRLACSFIKFMWATPVYLRRSFTSLLLFPLFLSCCLVAAESEKAQAAKNQAFQQCIAGLQTRAAEAGVPEKIRKGVLSKASFLERIISYDRNQPEFVQTLAAYFNKRVTDWRVAKGREMLVKHTDFLATLTATYGVPAPYLIAFWGLETNYGSYKGKIPTINSLVTLACDKRRSEYFAGELVQALLLMDRENLSIEDMQGSWAGAMGHTQFMPSAYMLYAKDGDNDGKKDLWNSELDALASAANFLVKLGWKTGFKWGREVSLPKVFDYQLAGKDRRQPVSFWAKEGVRSASGHELAHSDVQSSLLIPSGHMGPTFLVYDNFDIILRWNNSEYYGIAVGHLADRIAGYKRLSKPFPDLPSFTVTEMRQLQTKLNELGFNVGKADGILGPGTRSGIRGFQLSKGMIADGYPSREVFNSAVE